MSGYGNRKDPAVGVHDPLEGVALYLTDGVTELGIITADLIENSNKLQTTQDITLLFQHTGIEWLLIYERLTTTGQETIVRRHR